MTECTGEQQLWVGLRYELNCVPPQKTYESPNVSTSECDLILRDGLHKDNLVKIRLLGWAVKQRDRYTWKGGSVDTEAEMHTGKIWVKREWCCHKAQTAGGQKEAGRASSDEEQPCWHRHIRLPDSPPQRWSISVGWATRFVLLCFF